MTFKFNNNCSDFSNQSKNLTKCYFLKITLDCLRSNSNNYSRFYQIQTIYNHFIFSTIWNLIFTTLLIISLMSCQISSIELVNKINILSNENFTFNKNGSFLQIDADRDWPFNSKREISFRFKTKSPHGLLIYQTFDHNKLSREEDQENLENLPTSPPSQRSSINKASILQASEQSPELPHRERIKKRQIYQVNSAPNEPRTVDSINRVGRNHRRDIELDEPNSIVVGASERLVNSLVSFTSSATLNDNIDTTYSKKNTPAKASLNHDDTLLSSHKSIVDSAPIRANRMLKKPAEPSRAYLMSRSTLNGPTVLSSSTINSVSASIYELYLKLENGRLKIMYEFGSRLNQTYCGKGLNDDRWHKVELKVDPESNQMILVLDQLITVEIVLNQLQSNDDDSIRRNEFLLTNSVLYIGGINNNVPIVKNVKQRLYLAQFIGCIGQILLKTDQTTDTNLQPVNLDHISLIKFGCLNKCDTDNYCLHNSNCVNYYSHTKCDCLNTKYEDIYCWHDKLTTLTMLGHSTLVYRIYDWRDRHHSNINRLSFQFKTLATNSILFYAYGDLSAQNLRNSMNLFQSSSLQQSQLSLLQTLNQVNMSSPLTVHRPNPNQLPTSNSNYLAVSLLNSSIVVEINFGDQPIILSNLLYEKYQEKSEATISDDLGHLADGAWHNFTLLHNAKQLQLQIDNYSISYLITSKNNHLYFDPSIYIGAVPNLLMNETRALIKPFNLRHKFVGCLRSIYFNQHNILLDLKQNSPMVDYIDILGKPQLDQCETQDPNSLPLTLRSGRSYLTFQFTPNSPSIIAPNINKSDKLQIQNNNSIKLNQPVNSTVFMPMKKLTKIEFEYKTALSTYFLAGGHLRDSSYHDLGGFWTLHARDDCQLYFTISSGLTFEPEQVIKLEVGHLDCNPNVWFKISISVLSGEKLLNVTRTPVIGQDNDNSAPPTTHLSYTLRSSVELLHQIQLGGDLIKFGESYSVPFVGCIRKIMLNEKWFDSREFVTNVAIIQSNLYSNQFNVTFSPSQSDPISNRVAQGYVTLDSCKLINPCSLTTSVSKSLTISSNGHIPPCKNGGICRLNEFGEPDCDCSRTGYAGRRCQLSIYKQSCQELFLSGQRKSSYYLIDLDRNGPLKPIRVRCNMDDLNGYIETVLAHNLPAEYLIRGSRIKDISLDITYLAFHHMYTNDGFYNHDDENQVQKSNQDIVLRDLIGKSLFCTQYFRFECRSAPIEFGNRTWLEASYPKTHKIFSLNGEKYGQCPCATSDKKCLNPEKSCNCDKNDPNWSDDSAHLIGRENVGITKIVLLSQNSNNDKFIDSESQSRLTLSNLKCYGTNQHESYREITFKTSDAYIEVPGWRRGDISFSFRTASNPPAIILYQLATSRNHGYFRLTLLNDTKLLFEFIINRRPRKLILTSTHNLNNGEWQQVFIEYDSYNLRLTVNDDIVMIDLDNNDYLGSFEGPLFIGGAPSKYLVGDILKRNGFTGCFRGLEIDGRSVDLKSYLSALMPTVISGCQPSCTKNLCQNGGKCIEYWGSFECECSNPIAHTGVNCEINLNTNSITFVTQESHYVQVLNDSFPLYLMKNILLNIRTYQETALVLYANDHMNNFIQLHKNGSSLVLAFNSNNTIVMAQVPIYDEKLNDVTIINKPPSTTSNENPIGNPSSTLETSAISKTLTTDSNTNLDQSFRRQPSIAPQVTPSSISQISINFTNLLEKSVKTSNTSGSGQPIQIKIERHRLRTTFYVNNNFVVLDRPMILLSNYSKNPWLNPELELVRPMRFKLGNKVNSRMFLANIDERFNTNLPGFTGCIQGLSLDNQLFDFNRAHLTGEFKGEYRIGCKMHCDSLPCKNQGICIENWKEDKIQCNCDSTSFVGRLCDEDIAAIFNGHTSFFLYDLSKENLSNYPDQVSNITERKGNIDDDVVTDEQSMRMATNLSSFDDSTNHNINNLFTQETEALVNFLEVSLAFSADVSPTVRRLNSTSSVQVLLLMTKANSSRYFFLGLTTDGSLLVQEDYGSSMALSRIIKRQDNPYNDGYRHMVKYSRFNQSIQILVDYQTYLPTMSVVSSDQASKYSKTSSILVGSATTDLSDGAHSFSNYSGCISNLLIKMDDLVLSPLNDAFGHELESAGLAEKLDRSGGSSGSNEATPEWDLDGAMEKKIISKSQGQANGIKLSIHRRAYRNILNDFGEGGRFSKSIIRDVEQGKCALFKKANIMTGKRSVNEPKYTPLLEPRPVYMDPPRMKPFKRNREHENRTKRYNVLFYSSLSILIAVGLSLSIYVYILQSRYKSEKFRDDTPFFHKRDDVFEEQPAIE